MLPLTPVIGCPEILIIFLIVVIFLVVRAVVKKMTSRPEPQEPPRCGQCGGEMAQKSKIGADKVGGAGAELLIQGALGGFLGTIVGGLTGRGLEAAMGSGDTPGDFVCKNCGEGEAPNQDAETE